MSFGCLFLVGVLGFTGFDFVFVLILLFGLLGLVFQFGFDLFVWFLCGVCVFLVCGLLRVGGCVAWC